MVQNHDIGEFSRKIDCVNNIGVKKMLDELGLQEYLEKHIPELLSRKTRKEEEEERKRELEQMMVGCKKQ